ncbi:AraC family transcriptional regulator [Shimia sp. CNT1-13L.2]|uniref:AraC family transcriptional regulator n=1 Tax=Shimia sp. CNT1-13L.2 TaxID=2959663 RepID=UPI0020CED1B0|nr:AraC family transcriptional regulator [Shimia sp. CNT1-13L.2]MCP9482024.1 AraC family transcriptional regulator [Shimia sp. CNT1-13L.2]
MTRTAHGDKPRAVIRETLDVAANSQPAPVQPHATSGIQVMTLAQLTLGGPWQLEQLHVRDHHLFLWITRGQGRILLHGLRRGYGAHNAIFVPAGKLLSMEAGRHVQGQALVIPADGRVNLPDRTHQLRIQDGLAQAELTGLFDDLRREIHENRPLLTEALTAVASLVSIWLRRQMQIAGPAGRATAAERIVRRFSDLLSEDFRSGRPMAAYAEDLDITPTHLTRVCRQCAGLTAADMLNQMIQHEARTLLTRSDLPMNEIADRLGFGSAAYFSRFSQQHFGAAPSQIRKTAQHGS